MSGFWLVPAVGLPGALRVAAVINPAVAASVRMLFPAAEVEDRTAQTSAARTDPGSRRFLVTAGMLGSLAQGDTAGARQLWLREGKSIELGDDLLLRVLVARSGAE